MTDLILNILLAIVLIHAIVSARYNIDTRRLKAEEYGWPYIISTLVASVTVVPLWVWLAIETGRWQFAAMPAGLLLVAVGGIASRPKK